MNVADRLAQCERAIEFLVTDFNDTDADIQTALSSLVALISAKSNGLADSRNAHMEWIAAYRKRVEDTKAEVLARDGKLPPPINAEISIKKP